MQTECSADLFGFARVEGRAVVAAFDGGKITSDAGALLLGATDGTIRLVDRFAACFSDCRVRELVEHAVPTLVGQRVFGIALGYEDLVDHDELRHDPVMAVLAGKLAARRSDCAPLAGKSTLNRLELSRPEPTRYHKISYDGAAIEQLFVDLFLEAHSQTPRQITLDLDATDDPLHGHQEGRFFHGYYDCYCYLPLYVFCGQHLLAAKLRPANIDGSAGAIEEMARIVAQIRERWPTVRILLRGDSGFAREALMAWCENNAIDYLFGLARNTRLVAEIEAELATAAELSQKSGTPARRFKDFTWTTRDSWSRERRVVAKAEWTGGEANPRFVVTSLSREEHEGRHLYEKLYCARGDMENRIKECQLDLFADRTSSRTMRSNQLRLWFASMAYVLGIAISSSMPVPPASFHAERRQARRRSARRPDRAGSDRGRESVLRSPAADIRVIQALLGHEKLETTARYTRVATGMISKIESPLDGLSAPRRKRARQDTEEPPAA